MTSTGQPATRVTTGQPAYDTWEPERVRDEAQRRPAPIVEPYIGSNGSSPPSYGKPPTYNGGGGGSPQVNGKKTLV